MHGDDLQFALAEFLPGQLLPFGCEEDRIEGEAALQHAPFGGELCECFGVGMDANLHTNADYPALGLFVRCFVTTQAQISISRETHDSFLQRGRESCVSR